MTRGRLLHFGSPYDDLARAKSYTASGGTVNGTISSLNVSLGGLFPIGTADEVNGFILDGDYEADNFGFGFCSSDKSAADGTFTTAPEVTMTCTGAVSSYSQGVTIIFANDDLAEFDIVFKYNGAVSRTDHIVPTGRVVNAPGGGPYTWNEITVTFTKTAIPERYVKLSRFFLGRVELFEGADLVSCDITRECNMGGLELPAGVLSAVIANDAAAKFKYRQLILAYWGDNYLGHFYVEGVKKQGAGIYAVNCTDAIGVLATTPFAGTYMATDTDEYDAAEAIIGTTYYDLYLEHLMIGSIRGAVLGTNKRDALLAFALGAAQYVSSRYERGVAPVYRFTAPICLDIINTDETSDVHAIPPERIYNDADTSEVVAVSQLEIISHALTASAYGSIIIGNNRYNDTETTNTYTVTTNVGLPNVKRIAEAFTIITGKSDPLNTDPSDVYTIGNAVGDYLKHLKRLVIAEAVTDGAPADLSETISATVNGVAYKANVEKINYAFGASVMRTTYTAVVISEA